jgi:DNA helicase-2/ATP-dependent DNA helicase PcrA
MSVIRKTPLNPAQLEAVTHDSGPLLLLAGAGSGKTRVLAARIAYQAEEKRIKPDSILAVTFTNKAAKEMRDRVGALIGNSASSVWLGTFHGLGLRILRRERALTGFPGDFTVYNDDDQEALVKLVLKELDMSDKAVSPRALLTQINQAKNELRSPDEYIAEVKGFYAERVGKVYSLYQRKLRAMGGVDFGDLIAEPVRLFRENPRLLASYQERFRHALVDEYQDTNRAQYALMNLLAGGHRNLCAVGDPDQSIYGWRGADIRNILDFQRDWPDATLLRLEQNYRSTRKILAAANAVIEKNRERLDKTLWTENADGPTVVHEAVIDERDEARSVVGRMRSLMRGDPGLGYKGFAVFYRTNTQSRVFEELFMREGVPYTVVGGQRFYDRKEIRDALALLKTIANPADFVSFRRIINVPPRGIGPAALEKIEALARDLGVPVLDALSEALQRGIVKKSEARSFVEAVNSFRSGLGKLPLHETAQKLLEDTGYMGMLMDEGTEEAVERADNLHELISAIRDFEAASETPTLAAFLDQVALISDVDSLEEGPDRVTIMTLHSAKGLEFPVVFMTGMEEGLFPHQRSIGSRDGIEEERRLCYVGMTRAMQRLFLYSASSRTMHGETRFQTSSRFLDEIPSELLESAVKASERGSSFKSTAYGNRPGVDKDEHYYTLDESQLVDLPRASSARKSPLDETVVPDENCAESGQVRWRVGMSVTHPNFGNGIIRATEGAGQNAKLTVNFVGAGQKKLAVKYANLTPRHG